MESKWSRYSPGIIYWPCPRYAWRGVILAGTRPGADPADFNFVTRKPQSVDDLRSAPGNLYSLRLGAAGNGSDLDERSDLSGQGARRRRDGFPARRSAGAPCRAGPSG